LWLREYKRKGGRIMPKSLFTSKHHRLIAMVVRDSRLAGEPGLLATPNIVSMLCFLFRMDNPKFDPETFRTACGDKPAHSD